MQNFKHVTLILILSSLLTGCIANKQYRTEYPSAEGDVCIYKPDDNCAESSFARSNDLGGSYDLGFIEFDDQGYLFDREQKSAVMDRIRKIVASNNNVIMLTFIHGWNHNANGEPESGNISSFRQLLAETAKENPSSRVVGLYVAWRGQSLRGFLTYATFWGRKKTAHEVGQNGFTTTLLELEDIIKGQQRSKSRNTMVTIGHSFGGAALYSSIKNVLAERYIQSRPFGSDNSVEGFGDLVVIVNPAFESIQFQSLYELAQDECRAYPEDQLPRLIVLSAFEDKAVRWTFPIGRSISTVLEAHRNDASAPYCVPFELVEGVDRKEYQVNQRSADIIAIGHHEAYVTHILCRAENTECINEAGSYTLSTQYTKLASEQGGESWTSQSRIGNRAVQITDDLVLVSKNRAQPSNPYLNIFSQDEIIKGHNDIWNDEVRNFIETMIRVSATR
jgi:hypothetical protein